MPATRCPGLWSRWQRSAAAESEPASATQRLARTSGTHAHALGRLPPALPCYPTPRHTAVPSCPHCPALINTARPRRAARLMLRRPPRLLSYFSPTCTAHTNHRARGRGTYHRPAAALRQPRPCGARSYTKLAQAQPCHATRGPVHGPVATITSSQRHVAPTWPPR